jgi:hypothetical protein
MGIPVHNGEAVKRNPISVNLLVGFLLCLTGQALAESRPLRLTENGRSAYSVYLPAGASQSVRGSIDTLCRYIREISGAELPVTGTLKKSGSQIIVETGKSQDSNVVMADLGNDGFVIRTHEGSFYLTARSDQGIQNAVYTFLESYLGCRMFSPSVRIVPKQPTIVVPDTFDRQVPVISFRLQDIHDSSYQAWHKLSSRDNFGLFVHTFQTLVPPEKYFGEHPEYFSLLKGNRTPTGQLCLSNPEVLRIVTEQLRSLMKAEPGATFWSVSQNDTYVPCECDACRRIDSAEGSPSGSILTFVNQVAEQFPDMTISTLAYQYSRSAPKQIKPRQNVNIMLCSIECNRSKPLAEDPSSESFVKDVEDWSELTHNIFLWDYVIDFRNLFSPFPNLGILQPNIQFFARSGITSVFEQGLPGFGGEFAELRSYLISKLLWNPKVSIDSVMNDFLQGFYSKGAPYIRQYIDTMQSVMQASGEGLDIYGYPTRTANGYLSSRMLERYGQIFDEAERAVAAEPAVLSRVKTARLPVQFALLEQAKVAAADEGGCFEQSADGGLHVRSGIDSLLSMFVGQCKVAGVARLWEHGTSPDDYYQSTRTFLDMSTKDYLARRKPVTLASPASLKYHSGESSALTDGVRGWDDYHMHWLGFEGNDMDAAIDLGSVQTVSRIGTDFLQDINSWVFMPVSVQFSVSEDGRNYRTLGEVVNTTAADSNGAIVAPFAISFEPISARYVRVKGISLRTCPVWHKGSGGLAWIFIDEITVQ